MSQCKRLAIAFLIGALCGAMVATALAAPPPGARTAHRIQQTTIDGPRVCSATAIGRHAVLTASHCEAPTDDILVDNRPAHIAERPVRDGHDHTILLISGLEFKDIAEVQQNALEVGMEIHIFGNPADFPPNFYRAGRVSGIEAPPPLAMLFGAQPLILLDINAFFGDSGSGLFNADGKVVGVFSVIIAEHANIRGTPMIMKQGGAYGMTFEPAQLERAKTF